MLPKIALVRKADQIDKNDDCADQYSVQGQRNNSKSSVYT